MVGKERRKEEDQEERRKKKERNKEKEKTENEKRVKFISICQNLEKVVEVVRRDKASKREVITSY